MVRKLKTRVISRPLYINYLKRAEECLDAARNSFNSKKWNAATINAVHSCIAACDAMCVYFLGKRYAGGSHDEAVTLFKTIKSSQEMDINANRIARIVRIKNMAEYEERLVSKYEAERILRDCERLFEYIEGELP